MLFYHLCGLLFPFASQHSLPRKLSELLNVMSTAYMHHKGLFVTAAVVSLSSLFSLHVHQIHIFFHPNNLQQCKFPVPLIVCLPARFHSKFIVNYMTHPSIHI